MDKYQIGEEFLKNYKKLTGKEDISNKTAQDDIINYMTIWNEKHPNDYLTDQSPKTEHQDSILNMNIMDNSIKNK